MNNVEENELIEEISKLKKDIENKKVNLGKLDKQITVAHENIEKVSKILRVLRWKHRNNKLIIFDTFLLASIINSIIGNNISNMLIRDTSYYLYGLLKLIVYSIPIFSLVVYRTSNERKEEKDRISELEKVKTKYICDEFDYSKFYEWDFKKLENEKKQLKDLENVLKKHEKNFDLNVINYDNSIEEINTNEKHFVKKLKK